MKAKEFDRRFDRGEDVTAHLNLAKARRPGEEQRRVNVDFPAWMIASLDREAKRLGVTRQSIIKVWIAQKLEHVASGQMVEHKHAAAGRPPGSSPLSSLRPPAARG